MAATEWFDLPVPRSIWQRLLAAAAASHQSVEDFMVSAAEERADEVLAAHTVVSVACFDALVAALDEPPERNGALRAVSQKRHEFKQVCKLALCHLTIARDDARTAPVQLR
jgi:uncharacterized protein (DUF1778 family)